jgi:hypothetical protein
MGTNEDQDRPTIPSLGYEQNNARLVSLARSRPCSVTTAASSPTSAPGHETRAWPGEQFGRPAGERRAGNVVLTDVRRAIDDRPGNRRPRV